MEMIVDLKEKMEEKIKEACEVIETNISFENNFVIYDKEGVLLNRYGNALEECGYDVRILNLCDFNKSNQYNPLAYVDKPEEVMELAYYIIDIMSSDDDGEGVQIQFALLSSILLYLKTFSLKHQQNLSSVMKLLRAVDVPDEYSKSKLDVIFEEIALKEPGSPALKQYVGCTLGHGVENCYAAKLLLSKFSLLNHKSFESLVIDDDISLANMGYQKKVACFVVLPLYEKNVQWIYELMTFQLIKQLNDLRSQIPISFINYPEELEYIIDGRVICDDRYIIKQDINKKMSESNEQTVVSKDINSINEHKTILTLNSTDMLS